MRLASVEKYYQDQISSLLSEEDAMAGVFQKMASAGTQAELAAYLEEVARQKRKHRQRLDLLIKQKGFPESETENGAENFTLDGMLRECKEILYSEGEPSIRDVALLAFAQRLENFQISGYGTVLQFAKGMGDEEAGKILKGCLQEKVNNTYKMMKLAEGVGMERGIHAMAVEGNSD